MSDLFIPIVNNPAEITIADNILRNSNALLKELVVRYKTMYDGVWNNPKATPDKIVAAMGTQAVSVFTRSAQLAAYLVSQGATVPTTMPSGWSFDAKPDGSVVLTKVGSGQ